MRIKALVVLFFLLSWTTGSLAATFSVKVLNGTEQAVLSNYPVTVRIQETIDSRSKKILSAQEGRTDSRGIFDGEIPASAGNVLVAEINYRGIPYFSEPVTIGDGRQNYDLMVAGYEITSSHAKITIPSRTLMMTPIDERTLEVYDTLQVVNDGHNTYVGAFNDELDVSQVLNIPVPENYRLLGYQAGSPTPKIRMLGRAIVTQNEIKPGNGQILLRYQIFSDIGFFDLSMFSEKDVPEVGELNLYFPDSGKWRIKSNELLPAGQETFGSTVYKAWKGSPGPVLRLKAYGPAYGGGFNLWHLAIIVSFLVAVCCLLLSRHQISNWHLRYEERKLQKLRDLLVRGTGDPELRKYYQPFKLVLDNRIQETKQILKAEEHASSGAVWHKKRV